MGENVEMGSTNGVNVFIQSYLADLKTGVWKRLSKEEIKGIPYKILAKLCRSAGSSAIKSDNESAGHEEIPTEEKTMIPTRPKKPRLTSSEAIEIYQGPSDMHLKEDSNQTEILYSRTETGLESFNSGKTENVLKDINTQKNVNDDDAFLSIWDFAGDEVYEATHHIFMSPDAVYLLVFNMLECLKDERKIDNISKWQNAIHSFSDEQSIHTAPIILIGTHYDQFGETQEDISRNTRALEDRLEKYEVQIESFFQVDNTSKNDDHFKPVRDAINDAAQDQMNWNKLIPATWLAMAAEMNLLKQERRVSITASELNKLSDENEEPLLDKNELDLYLRWMNQSGKVLYIPEGSAGSVGGGIVIADPQKLVNAFRCIIKAEKFDKEKDISVRLLQKTFRKTGLLRLDLLEKLWNNEFRDFKLELVQIMQWLNLLVQFDSNTWLVPCMLNKSEVSLCDTVTNGDQYAIVSKSLCLVFKSARVPFGLYDKLLAKFMSSYRIKGPRNEHANTLLKRGSACFAINSVCYLFLQCKGLVITLTLLKMDGIEEFDSIGHPIRELLCKTVAEILKRHNQTRLEFEICLHCSEKICDSECPTPITDIRENKEVPCCVRHAANIHFLTKNHLKPWFEQTDVTNPTEREYINLSDRVLNGKPTNEMIAILTKHIGDEYFMFFHTLGLNQETIDSVGDLRYPREKFGRLLNHWRDKSDSGTLEEILRAMKNNRFDHESAANEISSFLKIT